MKNLLIIFSALLFLSSSQWVLEETFAAEWDCPEKAPKDPNEKPRICYFQVSTSKEEGRTEYENLENEIKKIEATNKLEIEDFYADEAVGTAGRFEKMIQKTKEKGKKCHALVLSGYHTGDFISKEKGLFPLEFLEKLSCREEYQDWFCNVKGLYLHGSNTVRDTYLKGVKDSKKVTVTGDSDSTSTKKTTHLTSTERSSDTTFFLNHSYADTLDEHTPLSSRYLRAFPNTNIFGFSEIAGFAKGFNDIFNHISQVGNALAQDDDTSKTSVADEFISGLKAITSGDCSHALEEWNKLNTERGTEAVKKKDYTEARKLGCELINSKQILDGSISGNKAKEKEKIIAKLEEITKKKELSHLLINNIYETIKLADNMAAGAYGEKDRNFITKVKGALKNSNFQKALEEKLASPILSSLKKADHIKLYQRLWGDTSTVTNGVTDLLNKANTKLSQGNHNEKILGALITDQLSQYNLLTNEQINTLKNNSNLFPEKGTDWQKAMKQRLEYRSYFKAPNKAGHNFNVNNAKGNPSHVQLITEEALKKNDMETLFKLAQTVAPENYLYRQEDGGITDNNIGFAKSLQNHIRWAPKGESRLDIAKKYLEESSQSDTGKDNFQANLLWALYSMPDEEFQDNPTAYGDANSKKAFFDQLKNSSNYFTEHSQPVYETIQRELNKPPSQ